MIAGENPNSSADGGGVQTTKNNWLESGCDGRVAGEKEQLTGREPLTGGTPSFVRGQGR